MGEEGMSEKSISTAKSFTDRRSFLKTAVSIPVAYTIVGLPLHEHRWEEDWMALQYRCPCGAVENYEDREARGYVCKEKCKEAPVS